MNSDNYKVDNEALLKAMFENIDGATCYLDVNKKLLLFNKNFADITKMLSGKEPQVGDEAYNFLPEVQKKERYDVLDKVLKGNREVIKVSYFINGQQLFYKTSLNPVITNGLVTGITSFTVDQTQSKMAEITRRISDARFRAVVDNCFDGIVITDNQFNKVYESQSLMKLTGWDEEELFSRIDYLLTHPEDRELFQSAIEHSVASPGTAVREIIRMLNKDSEYFWAEVVINNLTNDPDINGFVFILHNISERIKAEEKLKNTNERLNYHINNTPLAVVEHDDLFRVTFWSKRAEEIFGWKEEEVMGKNSFDFLIYADDIEVVDDKIEAMREGVSESKYFEARNLTKDGNIIYCRWHNSALRDANGKVSSILSIIWNYTEQYIMELELREAVAKFRSLAEKSLVGIYIIQDNRLAYINPKFAEIFGYEESELNSSFPVKTLVDESYRKDLDNYLNHLVAGKETVFHEIKGVKKDGQIIYFELFGNSTEFNGKPAIIGTLIDITRRKRAESRLRKSEANMNAIFNNTDIAYVLVDRKLRLLSYNEAAANFARKELKVKARPGDYVPDLFPPGKKERMAEFFGKAINGEMTEYEVCYQQPDQGCNWYNVRIFPISGGADVTFGSIATVTDITERKRTELNREQITKDLIYRNEALNQFTYIISHNLRAPVSSILGLANVLNEMEMTNEEKSEAIAGIAEATHKLDEVIKDLNNILQVKNEVHRYKEEVSFSGLVAEIEIYINRFYVDEKINIITDFSALEKFNTIKSYFHSIFYNLISNSIKYRNPRIDAVIEIRSEISGDFFALTFKDNGIGFNLDEVGDRIFEMYRRFHLHVEGKGMGLYMVKTQVESLGGKIFIKSEVNKGTEFRLEFPI